VSIIQTTQQFIYSYNGNTWFNSTTPTQFLQTDAWIMSNGNGIVVANVDGLLYNSIDHGINFTRIVVSSYGKIKYINNNFITGNGTNGVVYSNNGINWSIGFLSQNLNMSSFNSIYYK
jgi:hypothetical protein